MTCSYNVLEYASDPHEAYTREYGGGRALGRAFIVGMNPGPWGMVSARGVYYCALSWLGGAGRVLGRVITPRE